jgi:L,D-transpeptidase ErfK/SrfK
VTVAVIALDYDVTGARNGRLGRKVRRVVPSLRRAWIMVLVAATIVTGAAEAGGRTAKRVTGAVRTYEVLPDDSWQTIAARFGVDARTLAADNRLTIETPLQEQQQLQVDNRHIVPDAVRRREIVVNVPQRMLFFSGEGELTAFPVAVGRSNWRTPLGPFTIVRHERDPSWEVPQSILEEARRKGKSLPPVVPPGPENPLGKFWLGLSLGSVGIHGTNAPATIYRSATHGCIRLHPDDIATLFEDVNVGTSGEVIYEPVLLAVDGDDILLEAHPDVYHRTQTDPITEVTRRAALLGVVDRLDMSAVAHVLKARDGIARSVAARGNRLTPSL